MPVSLQADYDHLRQLARELGYHADDVYATLVRLQYHLDVLTSGGWIGYAADRFFDEMYADIFPFLNQFNAELTQIGINIANLVELFQQTDDNLRPYFQSTDGTRAAYYFPGNAKYSTVKLERTDSAPNLGSWSKVDGLEVNMDVIEKPVGDPNLKQSGDPHGAAPLSTHKVTDVTLKRGVMSSDDPYVLTSVDHAATDTSQKFSLPEVDDEVLVGFSGGGSTAAPENAWPTKWYVPPENSGSNAELLPFMEQDLGLVKPDHRGETGLKIDFTPKADDGDDTAFKFFTPKE